MSKPAGTRGLTVKRTVRRLPYKLIDGQRNINVGTQNDISLNGEGTWIGLDQAKEAIDLFSFSDDNISDRDDSNDDIPEDDIKLTEGEIRAIIKQKGIPDQDFFMECNPDEVELCAMDIKERRYRLKRGLTEDSVTGDPVIPKRMVISKKIRPSPGARRGLHYVSAPKPIPNRSQTDFKLIPNRPQTDSKPIPN